MKLLTILLLLAAVTACAPAATPDGGSSADAVTREVIATDEAPAAIGPYSQAIRVGNTLYSAGQIGMDPATGEMVAGGVEAETRQALENLGAVLRAAGFDFGDVVQAQVFLADLEDYAAMNAIYAEYLGASPPARAAVQVARVPRDARVEIMLVAVRSG